MNKIKKINKENRPETYNNTKLDNSPELLKDSLKLDDNSPELDDNLPNENLPKLDDNSPELDGSSPELDDSISICDQIEELDRKSTSGIPVSKADLMDEIKEDKQAIRSYEKDIDDIILIHLETTKKKRVQEQNVNANAEMTTQEDEDLKEFVNNYTNFFSNKNESNSDDLEKGLYDSYEFIHRKKEMTKEFVEKNETRLEQMFEKDEETNIDSLEQDTEQASKIIEAYSSFKNLFYNNNISNNDNTNNSDNANYHSESSNSQYETADSKSESSNSQYETANSQSESSDSKSEDSKLESSKSESSASKSKSSLLDDFADLSCEPFDPFDPDG